VAAWYYAAPQKLKPLATVILLHDLAGSHAEVEPLALALQRAGCAVVAPDLRGHGASCTRLLPSGREESIDSKSLRKSEIEAIVASAGGRIRDQASMRGDIEAVRHFLKGKEADSGPNLDRLCIVGAGAGATLAALWTMADAAWPPTTTGPQGGQVRAVVCISPVWAVKGVNVLPALTTDPLKRDVPVLVLGGRDDRDAVRLFDQLKRSRPQGWFEQRAGQAPAMAPKLSRATDADVLLMQFDMRLSGEKLAVHRAGHPRPSGTDPSELIKGFLAAVLVRK
jgi:alpha-beta hydrolase superfamily lysophospholipase